MYGGLDITMTRLADVRLDRDPVQLVGQNDAVLRCLWR